MSVLIREYSIIRQETRLSTRSLAKAKRRLLKNVRNVHFLAKYGASALRCPPICKRLHFKLIYLLRKIFNALFIFLAYCVYFLYGIADLHGTGGHLVHAVGNDAPSILSVIQKVTITAFLKKSYSEARKK